MLHSVLQEQTHLLLQIKHTLLQQVKTPIEGESAYALDDISRYKKAISAEDIEISKKAKASAKPGTTAAQAAPKKATSLL